MLLPYTKIWLHVDPNDSLSGCWLGESLFYFVLFCFQPLAISSIKILTFLFKVSIVLEFSLKESPSSNQKLGAPCLMRTTKLSDLPSATWYDAASIRGWSYVFCPGHWYPSPDFQVGPYPSCLPLISMTSVTPFQLVQCSQAVSEFISWKQQEEQNGSTGYTEPEHRELLMLIHEDFKFRKCFNILLK